MTYSGWAFVKTSGVHPERFTARYDTFALAKSGGSSNLTTTFGLTGFAGLVIAYWLLVIDRAAHLYLNPFNNVKHI